MKAVAVVIDQVEVEQEERECYFFCEHQYEDCPHDGCEAKHNHECKCKCDCCDPEGGIDWSPLGLSFRSADHLTPLEQQLRAAGFGEGDEAVIVRKSDFEELQAFYAAWKREIEESPVMGVAV